MKVDYSGMAENLKGDLKKASDKNKRIEEQANKTSELKRCAFCGGDNVGLWYNRSISPLVPSTCGVHCYDCHFGLSPSKTKEEAIKAWNNRKPLKCVIERLEEEARKAERNSKKAEALGEAYERHYVFFGAKESAYRKAIEIIKEEMMK